MSKQLEVIENATLALMKLGVKELIDAHIILEQVYIRGKTDGLEEGFEKANEISKKVLQEAFAQ